MTRRGLLLFAAMCVIWGIPYLLIRVAVGEISPVMLVFVRTSVAALILLPFVVVRGGWRTIGARWCAARGRAGVPGVRCAARVGLGPGGRRGARLWRFREEGRRVGRGGAPVAPPGLPGAACMSGAGVRRGSGRVAGPGLAR